MAFTINEQKTVLGQTLNSIYCRVVPHVNVEGQIYASPMLFISEEAYQQKYPIRFPFDVVELRTKYDESTGLPLNEFLEIPIKKDLSGEQIYVGMIENEEKNYLEMATVAVIEHLVKIKFIDNQSNVTIH